MTRVSDERLREIAGGACFSVVEMSLARELLRARAVVEAARPDITSDNLGERAKSALAAYDKEQP